MKLSKLVGLLLKMSAKKPLKGYDGITIPRIGYLLYVVEDKPLHVAWGCLEAIDLACSLLGLDSRKVMPSHGLYLHEFTKNYVPFPLGNNLWDIRNKFRGFLYTKAIDLDALREKNVNELMEDLSTFDPLKSDYVTGVDVMLYSEPKREIEFRYLEEVNDPFEALCASSNVFYFPAERNESWFSYVRSMEKVIDTSKKTVLDVSILMDDYGSELVSIGCEGKRNLKVSYSLYLHYCEKK